MTEPIYRVEWYHAVILRATDFRAVRTKIDELAIQFDECLTGVLVALIGGDSAVTRHDAVSILTLGVCTPQSKL